MHEIKILELGIRKWLPENLGECTKQQYLDMSKLVLMYQMAEIDLKQFRTLAFYNLMNMEREDSGLPNLEEQKWQNTYVKSQCLDSFFELDEEKKMHLVQDYIHNPVKSVKYKEMTFVGPKDGFKDIAWKQLVDGLGEVQSFLLDGKIERLVKLFAMYYKRPRELYGKFDMDKRVKFFDTLDIRYVYGFYLLMLSFWRFLTTQSIVKIDGKEINLTVLFDSKESSESVTIDMPELGLRSTSFQIAESGVFGTMQELDQTNAWEVMTNIYDMIVRNKKREAEYEAEKNKNKNP